MDEADDAPRLLRLLAEDAGSTDLRGAAASGPLLDDALAVRETIDAHRRRQSQLSALVDIARDLSSRSGPDGVLDTVVRRTRALLASDAAYLTLYDAEAGDTFMQATDGSISIAFQQLRLPLGAGLGGLVAQTRSAYATSNYPNDERFAHTGEIDSAVAEEGLVAICGTPLIVDEEFVGVLFASHRTPRTFTPEEIALLGNFAALAAVSILQSRAAREARDALAELSAAHETVRRYSEGIERAATAHDRFASLVLAGGGVDELCAALVDLLGGWAVALDPVGARLGSACAPGVPLPMGGDLAEGTAVRLSQKSGRLSQADGLVAVTIQAAGERLGDLVLGDVPPTAGPDKSGLDVSDLRTIERAAVVTALVLLRRRAAADAERRIRADLVSDLITGAGTAQRRTDRARQAGLELGGPLCVAVADLPASAHHRGAAELAESAVPDRSLIGSYGGDVVVIAPSGDPGLLAEAVRMRLEPLGAATVAAAGPVADASALPDGYREAARTVAALLLLGRAGTAATASALGFAGLVVGSEPDVDRFLGDQLGPLLDYDRDRGTDLLGTARAFFAAGSTQRRAADALHIHPNTLAQRLERIGRLLGSDWAEPQRALELQLALHLSRLSGGR
jgi:putative methionine-R-sulfoxide reductase with GAF domain